MRVEVYDDGEIEAEHFAGEFDIAPRIGETISKDAGGYFDMRDHFVLRRADLRPIRMASFKSGEEHVRVLYGVDKVETFRPGSAAMVEELSVPVWDGNL